MIEIKPKMNLIDVTIEERMVYTMDVTFEEVMDILDKWEFILGQREPEENCGALNLLMYKIKISLTSIMIWKRLGLFAVRNRKIQT